MAYNEEIIAKKYCFQCKKFKKNEKTKHCLYCNYCIDEFDHHCYWVNNCVSKNNIKTFFVFLVLIIVNLSFNSYISFNCLFIKMNQNNSELKNFSEKIKKKEISDTNFLKQNHTKFNYTIEIENKDIINDEKINNREFDCKNVY